MKYLALLMIVAIPRNVLPEPRRGWDVGKWLRMAIWAVSVGLAGFLVGCAVVGIVIGVEQGWAK